MLCPLLLPPPLPSHPKVPNPHPRKHSTNNHCKLSPNAGAASPMNHQVSARGKLTRSMIFLITIICGLLAVVAIVAGVIVLAVYIIYHPRLPYVKVANAHLNKLDYDQSGMLSVDVAISVVAENDNARAHARFSGFGFLLQFQGINIAKLQAEAFDVPKNNSLALNYDVTSSSIPLNDEEMAAMEAALQRDRVPFVLEGQARTRWRIGVLASVKFWTHLSCRLVFSYINGTYLGQDCSSKTH